MATKAQLKSYFETGDKPLSSEFDELIESCYGTDQQVYFDGTNIRLTNSDGSPDQIQNISNLNKQTLSYNDTTRELNLSGNTPAGPFGPILGLWTPVGMPTFSAGDISYPGNVGIGAVAIPTKKLYVNGDTRLTGSLQFNSGPSASEISLSPTLNGQGSLHSRLPSERAVWQYVESRADRWLFKGEQSSSVQWAGTSGAETRKIPFTTSGNRGFAGAGWQPTNNRYKIPEDGWYELGIRIYIDTTISIFEYLNAHGNQSPRVEGRFYLSGNTFVDNYIAIHNQAQVVQDIMITGSSVVKLSKDTLVHFEIRVSDRISGENVTAHPSPQGRRASQMTIKQLAV